MVPELVPELVPDLIPDLPDNSRAASVRFI